MVIGALLVSAVVLGWMLGFGRATGVAVTSSPTRDAPAAVATSDATEAMSTSPSDPMSTPSEAPTPSRTPAITSTPMPRPTIRPTPTPSPDPTPTPTPIPTPTPSPDPTAIAGLTIDLPRDGAILRVASIDIIGSAPPGATVTRDVPLWFDEHVTAGMDGSWSLPVQLTMGQNRLSFRIGDDRATERVVIVFRAPGP